MRSHHEMLDGSGYPDKLKGTEIPDLVRLVTICDIYGALIEHRPYRSPVPFEKAYGILQNMTGRLDGDLVRAFLPVALAFAPIGDAAEPAGVSHASDDLTPSAAYLASATVRGQRQQAQFDS